MTFYDYLSLCALILAIGVNAGAVYLQKTWHVYKRFGKNAQRVHASIISFFWGLFVVSEFLIVKSPWRLSGKYGLAGSLIMLAALGIFIASIQQIGWSALGNGNFFGKPMRKLSGIYDYIPEPIYVSYSLWLLGLGFITAQKGFFVLAIVCAIGLICFEAKIEKK